MQKTDAYRILDASLNRATEGLRVAEDICRFHWNLAGLSRELKELRHALRECVERAGGESAMLRWARDVASDPGAPVPGAAPPRSRSAEAPGHPPPAPARAAETRPERPAAAPSGDAEAGRTREQAGAVSSGRDPLAQTALRNLARARESLRSIEEVIRTLHPEARPSVEELRYRLYSLEKAVSVLESPLEERRARLFRARLCLLAGGTGDTEALLAVVSSAIEGGVDVVQLREKGLPDREVLKRARALRELTARAGVLFVVNDRPDIALLSSADGVHLGQEDLPPGEVRRFGGGALLVGVSTHSVSDALAALSAGADYIGVGPVFETATKDAGPPIGPEGLREVLARVDLPAFAIGGIAASNLPSVLAAGARRIAVSSAILGSADPRAAACALRALLEADYG